MYFRWNGTHHSEYWCVSATVEIRDWWEIPKREPIKESDEEIFLLKEDIEFKNGHNIH